VREDLGVTTELYEGLVTVAASGALLRLIWIMLGKLRQLRYVRHAVSVPLSWRDLCALPEPFVMAALAWLSWRGQELPGEPAAWVLVSALAAAVSTLLGLGLSLWAFVSFPSVSTGHYVLREHRVVSTGAYGFVRHPIYLGAFLIWLGLLLAFRTPWLAAVLVLYVLPAYWIYIRAEEEMLVRHLGNEYRHYRESVGGLFPRLK
jgi:protein-S-isoprenylcysteine O-methyltransferase Ste14